MARKFKLFGQEIMIGKRLIGVGKDEDNLGVAGFSSGGDTKHKLDSYRGVVYSCINLIAETYASYQPKLTKSAGDEDKVVKDHPFLQLLKHPGGTTPKAIPASMFDLLFATAAYIELQGDVYWYMALGANTRTPKEIVILRADKVFRDLDEDGEIKNFYVRRNNAKVIIEIDEILPFVGFDPKDPYKGIGTVEAASDYIATDTFSTLFTKNFFKNNAGISGVLSFSGDLVKGAFRKAVRMWRDRYQGVENAGKVMMIRGSDASFTKVGLGLNELDMSALRKMSLEDIAMMFRVPLALLGKLSEGTGLGRGNIETLEYIFAKYTIEPKLKRLDAILQFALERYYKTTDLTMGHQNIIPEDKEFELNNRDKGVDRWLTRNEIRTKDGLDDKEGGDQLFVGIQNIPVDEASFADTTAPATEAGKGLVIRIKRKAPSLPAGKSGKKKDSDQIESVRKENFRVRLMRNQIQYERKYNKKFKPVLVAQRKEALNNLEALASSFNKKTKDFAQQLFDDGAADILIETAVMPVLKNLGEDQGALALLFAGDEEHEFRMTAPYEKMLRESTKRMAKRFNDETLQKLNKTLAEGIQAGEGLGDLKKRVNDVYSFTEGYRALRVARTETLKASNNATNEAYKQTGYVTGKEWYVNPDACPECEPFDGKTIGLDEVFVKVGESYSFTGADGEEQSKTNDYDDIDNPPLHPNCRCTIIPIR